VNSLVEAHIHAKHHLQRFAAQAAASAWDGLPAYDRPNVPQFLSAALPPLAAANRQSVVLTSAYIARALGRPPFPINPAQIVAGIRNGATPDEVYTRPFVTVWAELGKGTQWPDAVRIGRDRAMSAAATDVQLAFRDTLTEVGQVSDVTMGYQRVADAGACDFCQEVDGAQFLTDDPMPLHNNCGCGVEPVEYARGEHFAPTPTPDTVAVNDHGELGPLLGAPGDHFTSEADIAA
jgi:hypothetical protein